ncbi:MAG: hypothetical protein CR971_00080 [candidate division SR1 bacterium]|nr:MAG: hypothetical protein CR971_00080 [candidate division SR1 bacterium]
MKTITYDPLKREKLLKPPRNIDIHTVAHMLQSGQFIAKYPHPDPERKNQTIYIINYNNYPYVVPVVETVTELCIKTAYQKRELKTIYSDYFTQDD